MSANTVKPTLRPKREKKVVENAEFDAFARRIVRAYARRVADGDIEALTALRTLSTTVDTATRDAVQGLRRFGYSWADIAARLGVTRQAAQMRWGARDDCGRLDPRILQHGMGITVAQLVAVFTDHHPGTPAATTCPACAYTYPPGATDCPTNAVVRPLLYQRRNEDKPAVSRLSRDQYVDLHDRRVARANRAAERQTASAPPSFDSAGALFDHTHGGQ
jgi:hypothetical protein